MASTSSTSSTPSTSSEFNQCQEGNNGQSTIDAEDFMAALILMNLKDQRIPSDRTEQYVHNVFRGVNDDGVGVEEIERFDHVLKAFAPNSDNYMDIIVDDNSDSDYSSESNSYGGMEIDHRDNDQYDGDEEEGDSDIEKPRKRKSSDEEMEVEIKKKREE